MVNLLGVFRLDLVQKIFGFLSSAGVVQGDARRGVEKHNDVAGVIAAEDLLFDLCGTGGGRMWIVPPFLAHAFIKLGAKNEKAQQDHRHDDSGNNFSMLVRKMSPSSKHNLASQH